MCTKSQKFGQNHKNTGKITKIRAFDGRFSTNARWRLSTHFGNSLFWQHKVLSQLPQIPPLTLHLVFCRRIKSILGPILVLALINWTPTTIALSLSKTFCSPNGFVSTTSANRGRAGLFIYSWTNAPIWTTR